MERVAEGEIIPWPSVEVISVPTMLPRLKRIQEVFQTIHEEELLVALPDCLIARQAHSSALRLLGQAEEALILLIQDLEDHAAPT